MKALVIEPGKQGVSLNTVNEPLITSGDEIKLKVLQVGICGTDRDEVSGGRADPPEGDKHLIIGHELFGMVTEVGNDVKSVIPGEYGLFTVRRECGECTPCSMGRSDMCYSGNYTERGIKSRHGFQSEFVVDKEKYFVTVPEEIKSTGVLIEPMSVAEKAIDEAVKIQALRIPGFREDEWFRNSRALVAGIGSVGLLASFILALRGAKIFGLDIVDEHSIRPSIFKQLGGTYINGKKVSASNVDDVCGEMDFIFEATGIAQLEFDLMDALGLNGIYALNGIPEGERKITIMGNSLMRQMVLKNQILLGSVNAGKEHFQLAVNDLVKAKKKWDNLTQQLISTTVSVHNLDSVFSNHSPDEIKVVVDWG